MEQNNKGESGGARAAYINIYVAETAYLINIITKSEQSDFTPEQISEIAEIVKSVKEGSKGN